MVSASEIMTAVGRSGLGSDAAASASAQATGLAARVRAWAQALAAQIEAEVGELQVLCGESEGCALEGWQSPAARAFREVLVREQAANRAFQVELGSAAVSTRYAGESVGAALDAVGAALGALAPMIDNALIGMGRVEGVLDDVVVYAERFGLTALQNELAGHLDNPLVGQVAGALFEAGR